MPGGALHTPAPRAKAGRMHSEGVGSCTAHRWEMNTLHRARVPFLDTGDYPCRVATCYGLCGRAFSSRFPTHCGVNGQVQQGC